MFAIETYPISDTRPDRDLRKRVLSEQCLLVPLKSLVRATRIIEGSYQHAIWRTRAVRFASLRGMFEQHRAEHSELLVLLEERIGDLGGKPGGLLSHCIFDTQLEGAIFRHALPEGLLAALKDNHDWLLRAASPSSWLCGDGTDWIKDFVVGGIVTSNQLQRAALIEELRCRDFNYRFVLDSHSEEM
jgi:DNA-binding ferritin-like protein